jgi:hypothetical protein
MLLQTIGDTRGSAMYRGALSNRSVSPKPLTEAATTSRYGPCDVVSNPLETLTTPRPVSAMQWAKVQTGSLPLLLDRCRLQARTS